MLETPGELELITAALSGALVILFGGGYAIAFALTKLKLYQLMPLAWCSYIGLVLSVVGLAYSLQLQNEWLLLAALMLVGYLLMPHVIWHLSEGTHAADTKGDLL